MYGAAALPRMSPRLWFSITMVKTLPRQAAGRLVGAALSGRHATDVFPEVLGPAEQATMRGARSPTRARYWRMRMDLQR
jgi:hypothetical protein